MDQWYYAKGGQQHGPMNLAELQGLVRNGTLDPARDLVWNPSMTDWLPVGKVPAIAGDSAETPVSAASHGDQPFAYPLADGEIGEIAVGTEPVIPTACVKRAFDLTVKHIGPLLLVTILWFVISVALSLLLQGLDSMMGWTPSNEFFRREFTPSVGMSTSFHMGSTNNLSFVSSLISTIVSVFLMLGATRIGLNITTGKPFGVGMIFSGGKFLVRGFFAYLLYWIMVVIGLILLVVPGVIVIVRLGMYQNAIVDRNLGIIDSFKYSRELTKGNALNLFVVLLFSILVIVAGCFALVVGLLFAFPLMWLMWTVAYRWLQYGGRAVLDDPTTGLPVLAGLPD